MRWFKKRAEKPVTYADFVEPAEFCDICGELAQGTRRCERHAGFVFKDVVRGDYETRA